MKPLKNSKIVINFVMSSCVESRIFKDIVNYFKKYSHYKIIQTVKPIKNANLYYYFRPHLEDRLKSNSIVTVHHDLQDSDINLNLEVFINRYKEAQLVVCLNSIQQKILKEKGIFNTTVIPHGYNHNILKPTIKRKRVNRKITLGFFSSFYPRLVKGEDYLIELSKELSPKFFKFILVGSKRGELAKELIKSGFECEVYENLPYVLFQNLYQKIDVLLITSRFEGGPASLPEAIATATPVITTKVGMATDFLDFKGIKFLSREIENDKKVLEKIKDDLGNMNRSLYLKGREHILTWEEVVNLYDNIFKEYSDKKSITFLNRGKNIFSELYFTYETLYLKKKLIIYLKLFQAYSSLYLTSLLKKI